MSIGRGLVMVIVLATGCGRVAPGTSTNARSYGTYSSSGGGGGGSTAPSSTTPASGGKVNCNPEQKGKYGSMCN